MLSLRSLSFVLVLTILLASATRAQSGSNASVTIGGQVSAAVLISIAPTAQLSDSETLVTAHNTDARTLFISIKIHGHHARQIVIPVLIRSNTGYMLSALAKPCEATPSTLLRGMQVTGARPTGRFVAVDAVEAMNVAAAFDATNAAGHLQRASLSALLLSSPTILLTGPRISLAGTPDSPHNAVEVTMLAEVEASDEGETQSLDLILSATPDSASSLPALSQK